MNGWWLEADVGLVSRTGIIPIRYRKTRRPESRGRWRLRVAARRHGPVSQADPAGARRQAGSRRLDDFFWSQADAEGQAVGVLRQVMAFHTDVDAAMAKASALRGGAEVVDQVGPTRRNDADSQCSLRFRRLTLIEEERDTARVPRALTRMAIRPKRSVRTISVRRFDRPGQGPLSDAAYLKPRGPSGWRTAGDAHAHERSRRDSGDAKNSPAWKNDHVLGESLRRRGFTHGSGGAHAQHHLRAARATACRWPYVHGPATAKVN